MQRGQKIWCDACKVWVPTHGDRERAMYEHALREHMTDTLSGHPDIAEFDADMEYWYG